MKKKIDRSRGMQSLQIACKRFTKYLVISNYFYFYQRWGRTGPMIADKWNLFDTISPLSENLKFGHVSQYHSDSCDNNTKTLICVYNNTEGLVLITILNESLKS